MQFIKQQSRKVQRNQCSVSEKGTYTMSLWPSPGKDQIVYGDPVSSSTKDRTEGEIYIIAKEKRIRDRSIYASESVVFYCSQAKIQKIQHGRQNPLRLLLSLPQRTMLLPHLCDPRPGFLSVLPSSMPTTDSGHFHMRVPLLGREHLLIPLSLQPPVYISRVISHVTSSGKPPLIALTKSGAPVLQFHSSSLTFFSCFCDS